MRYKNNYEDILTYNGTPLTDENVLKLYQEGKIQDLEDLLVIWCHESPLPIPELFNKDLINELWSLRNAESDNSTAGLKATHHFMGEKFLTCKGAKDDKSIYDVWYNDSDALRKAIRTRIGGLIETDTAGSEAIDCVFDITPQMLVQGIRSSRQGFYASNFKPALAKNIIQKYSTDNAVLDFSCGWGARLLAAISLNYNYYGIDPSTADECNTIKDFYSNAKTGFKYEYTGLASIKKGYSEDSKWYDSFPEVSLAFSCPPYYDYELYYNGKNYIQLQNTIEDWISYYWKPTIKNCMNKLKPSGKFIFVISNELKDIMSKDLDIIEEIPLTSCVSHLSKKTITKQTTKQNETIVVCRKS